MNRNRIAALLVGAILLLLITGAQPPANAANLGTQPYSGPQGTVLSPVHNTTINDRHGFWVDGCYTEFQYGNLGNAGFGRLYSRESVFGGSHPPIDCITSAAIQITTLVSGPTLANVPIIQQCTWKATSGVYAQCSLVGTTSDIWVQNSGPSSVVSVKVTATAASGVTNTRTFDPFPG